MIRLVQAKNIANAIEAKAADDGGKPVAIAVVNCAGDLVHFVAMDGVLRASKNIAIDKVRTAASFQRSTHLLIGRDPGNFDSVPHCFLGGAVPIIAMDGEHIGYVGVSGRAQTREHAPDDEKHLDHDHELALLGASVF